MVGTWQMITPKGTLTETWKQVSDTVLSGIANFHDVRGEKTFSEHLAIVARPTGTWYLATVPTQNAGQSVAFKANFMVSKEVTFVNYVHDFPKMITYRSKGDTVLTAVVAGDEHGRRRSEIFTYRHLP